MIFFANKAMQAILLIQACLILTLSDSQNISVDSQLNEVLNAFIKNESIVKSDDTVSRYFSSFKIFKNHELNFKSLLQIVFEYSLGSENENGKIDQFEKNERNMLNKARTLIETEEKCICNINHSHYDYLLSELDKLGREFNGNIENEFRNFFRQQLNINKQSKSKVFDLSAEKFLYFYDSILGYLSNFTKAPECPNNIKNKLEERQSEALLEFNERVKEVLILIPLILNPQQRILEILKASIDNFESKSETDKLKCKSEMIKKFQKAIKPIKNLLVPPKENLLCQEILENMASFLWQKFKDAENNELKELYLKILYSLPYKKFSIEQNGLIFTFVKQIYLANTAISSLKIGEIQTNLDEGDKNDYRCDDILRSILIVRSPLISQPKESQLSLIANSFANCENLDNCVKNIEFAVENLSKIDSTNKNQSFLDANLRSSLLTAILLHFNSNDSWRYKDFAGSLAEIIEKHKEFLAVPCQKETQGAIFQICNFFFSSLKSIPTISFSMSNDSSNKCKSAFYSFVHKKFNATGLEFAVKWINDFLDSLKPKSDQTNRIGFSLINLKMALKTPGKNDEAELALVDQKWDKKTLISNIDLLCRIARIRKAAIGLRI